MSVSVAQPQIEAGKLVGLVVAGPQRWPELPNVPSITEAGFSESIAITWQGIVAPAGTPKDIIHRLSKTLIEIVHRPDIRQKLLHAGFGASGRGPQQFGDLIAEDVPKWKAVIEKAGIRAN